MKIVILDGYTITLDDLSWKELETLGNCTAYDRTPKDHILEKVKDADAVFTSKCQITREIMEQSPNLKFIGLLATGYDNMDLEAAKELGIAICNIPNYSTLAVAQHTFALILEITNNVGQHSRSVHEGMWTKSADFCYLEKPMLQLSQRSLGIVGYGNIGKKVAEMGKAFGMTVNIYSRDPLSTIQSDILSLHCPATEENRGFINREFINQMKDGAIIINTARGSLINEEDLANALQSGKLSAAGLDVLSNEPPKGDHPLLGVPNLFLTPHIAWATNTARTTITEMAALNLKSFLEGGTLNRIV